jgi:hypothetical protein
MILFSILQNKWENLIKACITDPLGKTWPIIPKGVLSQIFPSNSPKTWPMYLFQTQIWRSKNDIKHVWWVYQNIGRQLDRCQICFWNKCTTNLKEKFWQCKCTFTVVSIYIYINIFYYPRMPNIIAFYCHFLIINFNIYFNFPFNLQPPVGDQLHLFKSESPHPQNCPAKFDSI